MTIPLGHRIFILNAYNKAKSSGKSFFIFNGDVYRLDVVDKLLKEWNLK